MGRRRDWGRVKLTFYLLSFQRNQASSFIPIAQGGARGAPNCDVVLEGEAFAEKGFQLQFVRFSPPHAVEETKFEAKQSGSIGKNTFKSVLN